MIPVLSLKRGRRINDERNSGDFIQIHKKFDQMQGYTNSVHSLLHAVEKLEMLAGLMKSYVLLGVIDA